MNSSGTANNGGAVTGAISGKGNITSNTAIDQTYATSNNSGGLYGNGSFVPLQRTGQTFQKGKLGERDVVIYDHPFGESSKRVCRQGTAFPEDGKGGGIVGTCGLCACATLINKAGGTANEKSVGLYALQNNQCENPANKGPEHRGGTNSENWVNILNAAGIQSMETKGSSLSELAKNVENGQGVIIAVTASLYNSDWYGKYNPNDFKTQGGHALVLESVVRDAETGQIVGYYVVDSNGKDSAEAAQYVDVKVLERAFVDFGWVSVTTSHVIW